MDRVEIPDFPAKLFTQQVRQRPPAMDVQVSITRWMVRASVYCIASSKITCANWVSERFRSEGEMAPSLRLYGAEYVAVPHLLYWQSRRASLPDTAPDGGPVRNED